MATRLPTATRNAAADAVVDLVDADTDPGYIEIRTGSQPASAGDAATGDLLVTFTLDDPAFGAAATGVATLAGTPLTETAVDTGTAGWFRMYDGADNVVLDGSVTPTSGGGQIEINTTSINTGVDVELTSGTVTMPAG